MRGSPYTRQLRRSRREAIYLRDHIFSLGSISLQRGFYELCGVGLVAALLDRGPADHPASLREIVNERPAIKAVAGQRGDVRRLHVFLIPVLLDRFGILAADVETDLGRAVREHIRGKGKLVHSLTGKDKGDAVFPAFSQ